jgi:uncharacterized damage-inducible protein DinB
MTVVEINKLYQYNTWANRRVLDSLQQLNQECFTRDLKASYGSIRGTLAHLAGAQWIWLERWKGNSPAKLLPESEFETVAMASRRLTEIDDNLVRYVEDLTQSALEEVKSYVSTEGKPYSNVLQDMLQHLMNHSTYHRGQIASLLRQVGAIPQQTDLILYLRTVPS